MLRKAGSTGQQGQSTAPPATISFLHNLASSLAATGQQPVEAAPVRNTILEISPLQTPTQQSRPQLQFGQGLAELVLAELVLG